MTTLIEGCPASALQRMKMCEPYKGRGEELKAARSRLARAFDAPSSVSEDSEGDALDSVIAARIAVELAERADWSEPVKGEGRVYF